MKNEKQGKCCREAPAGEMKMHACKNGEGHSAMQRAGCCGSCSGRHAH